MTHQCLVNFQGNNQNCIADWNCREVSDDNSIGGLPGRTVEQKFSLYSGYSTQNYARPDM